MSVAVGVGFGISIIVAVGYVSLVSLLETVVEEIRSIRKSIEGVTEVSDQAKQDAARMREMLSKLSPQEQAIFKAIMVDRYKETPK